MANTLANTVLNFNTGCDDDGRAYKIVVLPSSPTVDDVITIQIFSGDCWTLHSPYHGLSAKSVSQFQQYSENVSLSGSVDVSTNEPVMSLTTAISTAPIVDLLTLDVIHPAGTDVFANLSVTGGLIVYDSDGDYGSIDIVYDGYNPQSWTHRPFGQPGEYVLLATNKDTGKTEDVIITIDPSDGPTADAFVTIEAKDFCTDLPIVGASVYIETIYKGVTDAFGKLVVGHYDAGSHAIKLTATGYQDTDVDDLDNENFTI